MTEIKRYRCNMCGNEIVGFSTGEYEGTGIRFVGQDNFTQWKWTEEEFHLADAHLCDHCFQGMKDFAPSVSSEDVYKLMFDHALKQVDSIFQDGAQDEDPLLPGFVPLGDDKFEACVKLAKAYIRARDALKEILDYNPQPNGMGQDDWRGQVEYIKRIAKEALQ